MRKINQETAPHNLYKTAVWLPLNIARSSGSPCTSAPQHDVESKTPDQHTEWAMAIRVQNVTTERVNVIHRGSCSKSGNTKHMKGIGSTYSVSHDTRNTCRKYRRAGSKQSSAQYTIIAGPHCHCILLITHNCFQKQIWQKLQRTDSQWW